MSHAGADKLVSLAQEINAAFADEESARIRAGRLLLQAHAILLDARANTTFKAWCEEHVTRSWRDCRKCMALAGSDDPVQAQQEERRRAREGMATTRRDRAAAAAASQTPKAAADRANVRPASSREPEGYSWWKHGDGLEIRISKRSDGGWTALALIDGSGEGWFPVGDGDTEDAALAEAKAYLLDFYDDVADDDDELPEQIRAWRRGEVVEGEDDKAEPELQPELATEPEPEPADEPEPEPQSEPAAAEPADVPILGLLNLQIDGLKAQCREKDARIAELEAQCREKDREIERLRRYQTDNPPAQKILAEPILDTVRPTPYEIDRQTRDRLVKLLDNIFYQRASIGDVVTWIRAWHRLAPGFRPDL